MTKDDETPKEIAVPIPKAVRVEQLHNRAVHCARQVLKFLEEMSDEDKNKLYDLPQNHMVSSHVDIQYGEESDRVIVAVMRAYPHEVDALSNKEPESLIVKPYG